MKLVVWLSGNSLVSSNVH